MKKTKLFVSLFMWFIAILCWYTAKTNAIQLNINDRFFTWSILTWNYAEIHFQENNNDWYWIFFIWSWKTVNATLNLSDWNYSIHCSKQLNWYYLIPYTDYQMLWLDNETISYTNDLWLTPRINIVTWWLFFDCIWISPIAISNENMTWIYWYIKREYQTDDEIKNTHEIRAWLSKKDWNWIWTWSSPLQQVYSTTTWNHSRTMYWQFYSSLARSGIVNARPIWDLKLTNSNITYSGSTDQYDISVYEYAENGINLQILSAKPGQTWVINLTYIDNHWHPAQENINVQAHSSTNDFWFLWETFYEIKKENIQIKPDSTWKITLTYPWENGNPDRSFSINFRITDENFYPCLTWYDHKFLTQDFWNQSPTNYNIKCAIFGYSGDSGYWTYHNYKTAYTSWRNDGINCTDVDVEFVSSLPNELHNNMIYVLSGSDEIPIWNVTMWECSAIVSPSKLNIWNDVTLKWWTITFNGESKHSVLDNVSIQTTNPNWILINNTENITLNMVKIYNANKWINLESSDHILLNNIQSFNNNFGIYMLNASNNVINNSQIYRDDYWVYMERSTNNIIYNSEINQNVIWLYVTTWSNNNTFLGLLINNNYEESTEKNRSLFIKSLLTNNMWYNIQLWDYQWWRNYFMEYTWNTSNLSGYQTSMEITWYTRIMKKSPARFPYEYYCQWWTSWTCYLQAQVGSLSGLYLFQCTGTYHTWSEDETLASYRHISADWEMDEGETWNFNTTSWTQATFTEKGTGKIEMNWNLISTDTWFLYTWYSGGDNNMEDAYFIWDFHSGNNYAIIEYKMPILYQETNDSGEIIHEYYTISWADAKIYTGTRHEIFTEAYYTWYVPISSSWLDERWNEALCNLDWYLTTGTPYTESGSYWPYVFHSSWYIFNNDPTQWTFVTDDTPFYINHMTNPETSHNNNETWNSFRNSKWTFSPHGKTSALNNTIKRYSYWIHTLLQSDVFLRWWSTLSWSVNKNFYIWSNIPKPSLSRIPWYEEKKITKVHFRLGITWNFSSMQGPVPTNYHIISLRDEWFGSTLDNVNTILVYTGGHWTWRNEWTQTRKNDTTRWYKGNKYMNLPIWSWVDIYLEKGNTVSSYPIIYQVYNTWNYYFTHRRTNSIKNRRLTFNFGGNSCLPPDTEDIYPIWYFNNYERDTTWFYRQNVYHHWYIRDGVRALPFEKIGTWKYQWHSTIPCFTWELCRLDMYTINMSTVEDILEFKLDDFTSKAKIYKRDMQWPSISDRNGTIEECNAKSIQLVFSDDCNCVKKYYAYSDDLDFAKTGINNNCNENNFVSHGRSPRIEFSSWQIGRTWGIYKTWQTWARDFYGNYQRSGNNRLIETWYFSINITNTWVTINTWKTKNNHLKYTWDWIINYYMTWWYAEITWLITWVENAEIIINPIELLWAQEWNCGTWDLYVANVQCFTWNLAFSGLDPRFNFTWNVLTWQIIPDANWHNTLVKIFHYNKKTFDIVTCAFNIKDNEWSWVTGYIWFRINTLHVPLIDPEIVSWAKYIDYSGNLPERYDGTRQQYTHSENQKYSSWDLIYINLHANDCVHEYYASCNEYYYRSWIWTDEANSDNDTWILRQHELYTGFDLTDCKNGIENFSGTKTWIKISVRNWEYTEDNGFFTNIKDTEDIVYDYTSPLTELRDTGNYEKIIAWNQTMNLRVRVSDKFKINDYLVNDDWELDTSLLSITMDTWWNCTCRNPGNTCLTGLHATFESASDDTIRILAISWTINIRENRCEGWIIWLNIDTWLVEDFAINPSTKLDVKTNYIYTNKTAIYVDEWTRLNNSIDDRRVAIKNIEWKSITWEIPLKVLTNLPFESEEVSQIACTWFNESWHFICLKLELTWDNHEQKDKQICKTRDIWWTAPYCEKISDTGVVIFNNEYEVWFTICSWYTTVIWEQYDLYINECTGRYSTNDTTWNWLIYGNIKAASNQYNEDYLKIQIYRQKSPFKAWDIRNETFFYWELTKALTDGNWDNWFIFYISHPQKIRTWNVSGWTIWEISYDLNFSTWVADEFYYITWEAIVNWFKQSRSIKRPTYNYSNPKGYLFNFPDYENYE